MNTSRVLSHLLAAVRSARLASARVVQMVREAIARFLSLERGDSSVCGSSEMLNEH